MCPGAVDVHKRVSDTLDAQKSGHTLVPGLNDQHMQYLLSLEGISRITTILDKALEPTITKF